MSKTDKAKLDAGAAKIREAEKQSEKEKALIPTESPRPLDDILRDHVTVLPDHIGLKLSDAIPIEESLRVLDWTTELSDHVGFMVGDVLNHGQHKWGEKYKTALNHTGRAATTLRQYASVAARIPPDQRKASLSFWQHELIVRTPEHIMPKLLNETANQAETGNAPTNKELRIKVRKLTPRKPPKRVTTGKGRKQKCEPPPYEPTVEEQSKLDEAEDKATELTQAVKGLYNITAKLDTIEKRRWLTLFEPFTEFHDKLNLVTSKL